MKALNLALSGKVTEHIIPSFKKIDSFLKEWNIEIKDKRELFLGIANVLKENKRYLTKRLTTCKIRFLLFMSLCISVDLVICFVIVLWLLCYSSSSKDSFKFLTKYLATFSGEDAYTMGEAKEEAVRTIIEFVKAPDMFQVNMKGSLNF